MGAHISQEVLPGLYISGMGAARDRELLRTFGITHIVSLMPDNRSLFDDIEYLIVPAEDAPTFAIHQHFRNCNTFIHGARKKGGKVLIHCMAGKSRSVTICVAYVMSCTSLTWKEALDAVRAAHSNADPNFGFRGQLRRYFEDCNADSIPAEQSQPQLIVAERDYLRSVAAELYDVDDKHARVWYAKQLEFIEKGAPATGLIREKNALLAGSSKTLSVCLNADTNVLPLPTSSRVRPVITGKNEVRGRDCPNDSDKESAGENSDSIEELLTVARSMVVSNNTNSSSSNLNVKSATPSRSIQTKRIACGGGKRFPPQLSALNSLSLSHNTIMCASPPHVSGASSTRLPATPQFTSPRLPSTPVCCSRNPSSSALPMPFGNRSNVQVSRVDGVSGLLASRNNNNIISSNGDVCDSADGEVLSESQQSAAEALAPPRMVIDLHEYFTKAMQDKLEAERNAEDAAADVDMNGGSSSSGTVRQRLSFSPSTVMSSICEVGHRRNALLRNVSTLSDEYDAASLTTTPQSLAGNANMDDDSTNSAGDGENAATKQRYPSAGDEEMFQLDAV